MEHGLADPAGVVAALEQDPRVRAALPRLQFTGLLSNGEKSAVFVGSGVDAGGEFRVRGPFLTVNEGSALSATPPPGELPEIMLGAGLARTLRAAPGSTLTLLSTTTEGALNAQDVRVRGVYSVGVAELDERAVLVHLPTAQRLLVTDRASTVAVYLHRMEDVPTVRAAMAARFPDRALRTWLDQASFYVAVRALYDRIFGLLGMVIVVIVLFAISNTIGMAVVERTREIGTLRAMGAVPGLVTRNFVLEGLVVGAGRLRRPGRRDAPARKPGVVRADHPADRRGRRRGPARPGGGRPGGRRVSAAAPTALLVDDEPAVRAWLRRALSARWPDLCVAGEAQDGAAALERFEALQPDVVFLDVQMPGATGLEVARALSGRCHVVFVTAHEQYALQAFEHAAVDYLLKPVDEERLAATVARLRARLAAPPADVSAAIEALARRLQPAARYLEWLQVQVRQDLVLVAVDDVDLFQSSEKYTLARAGADEWVIRTPLKDLEGQLDPARFWRVHRSAIVRVAAIARVSRDEGGQPVIHLRRGDRSVAVSRAHAHRFKLM